jgi:uncharacterized repeat protein (TIGR01451 family)
MVTQTTVSTDAQDYPPGAWTEITATGFDPGSIVTFQVQHAGDPGADGIWGTLDDVIVDLGGEGHEAWSVEDGSELDLDGAVNGAVVTSWYVNPDDSLNWHFLLTAMAANQQTASAGFTDSAGSYTLKWYASDPAVGRAPYLPTYGKLSPEEYLNLGNTYPEGRADLTVSNPLDNAVAYGATFSSNNLDAVTSLAPKNMALGQIVPFQMAISVTGSTAPENGVITFTNEWLAKTTSGGNFGFDTNYKVIAAFVDTGDAGTKDAGAQATVDQFSSTVVGVGTNNEAIRGTFQVSGLDNGDNVIVEIWVVLDNTIPANVTGNVQTSLVNAHTGAASVIGSTISTGNQTVPLLKVQDFFSSSADLSVIKSDTPGASNGQNLTAGADPDPVGLKPGDTFTYTILAENNSTDTVANIVVVTDSLDPYVEFLYASAGGSTDPATNTVTWNLSSLSPGVSQLLSVTVRVKDTAPTTSLTQDLQNTVSISAITADPNTANNVNTEATDLVSVIQSMLVTKAASMEDGGTGADEANDVIKYVITVENTGNTTLTDITVTDPYADAGSLLRGADIVGDNDALLEVGETWSYTAKHTVTQAEIDSNGGGDGSLENTVTADSKETPEFTAKASVPLEITPAWEVMKTFVGVTGGNGNDKADAAGDVLNYKITVTNTGNVALTNVVVTDSVEGRMATAVGTIESLAVGASQSYDFEYTLLQSDLNDKGGGDGDIDNTATAAVGEVPEKSSEEVRLVYNPNISINKVTTINGFTGDNLTGVTGGQPVTWTYTVTNTGNVSLTNVVVNDDNGTPLDATNDFSASPVLTSGFNVGDSNTNNKLDPGEKWTYSASGTAISSGTYTNTGKVTATAPDNSTVSQSDSSSYTVKAPTAGLIAPTSTTVNQYLDGSALSFQQYYDFQGGVIQYSTSLKTEKISQTNPGVLFYFTGASGSIKVADGKTTEQLSVTIDQTVTLKSGTPATASLTQNNIQLYQVVDANKNGKYDAGETVNTLSSKSYSIDTMNGDITLNFTGKVGSFYVASVKYDTSGVVSTSVGKNAATWPTVNYQFDTMFKSTMIETYAGGVDLAPKKPAPMLLEGEQGNGARAVNDAQIKHVINAAVCWWEDQGITADQLAQLKSSTVEITNLGEEDQGLWLGAASGSLITIDDDAAEHGWSLGLGDVAQNKVDLFSVLVHEMGHVLGKTDEQMGASLAVGERMLPMTSTTPPGNGDDQHGAPPSTDHGRPDVDQLLALVGSDTAAHQIALHMS